MSNAEKYLNAFVKVFGIKPKDAEGLRYQDIKEWDSVGHMSLISELENVFGIMMDTNDIIDFNSYDKGKEILTNGEYGVKF